MSSQRPVQNNFNQALKYVLRDEGGNDDDPQDHGGRTSRGITQREYNAWCRLNSKPQGDVWYASDDDIRTIYHDQYWNPYCNSLPGGIDYLFFDISVNSGRTQAVRIFQKALGVKVDGMMGQVTLSAIVNNADKVRVINTVCDKREAFYRSLGQFSRYGRGWLSRNEHCRQGALSMLSGNPVTPVLVPKVPKTKDQKPSETTVSPEVSGSTGTAAGGFAAILAQLKDSIAPYATELKYVSVALLGIAGVSFAYAMYGLYTRSKTAQAQ